MVNSENISDETLEQFYDHTKYDIRDYFRFYVFFMENNVENIYDFYSGELKSYPTNSFSTFNDLVRKTAHVLDVFKSNANFLSSSYEYWVLLELVEDISSRLDTIGNFSKWARSAIRAGMYSTGMKLPYVQQDGQSLESIAGDIEGGGDPQNDWVDIALSNDLPEEGYVPTGGTIVQAGVNNTAVVLASVVDNLDTIDKTFGLDIDRYLTFVDNDLNTLGYADTVKQACEILFGLRKGDNPFFPNQGVDEKAVVGNSTMAVSYPIIIRQLNDTVLRDDTIASISLTAINKQKDGSFMEFDVVTTGGLLLKQGVLVK